MEIFEKSADVVSTTTIMKDEVRSPSGEHLGNIEDLMIDIDTGRVRYAVLSFGGFLGLCNKLFAIPWPMLQLDPTDHAFIVDVDRKTLVHAPDFDKDTWPETTRGDWLVTLYRYYNLDPRWPLV